MGSENGAAALDRRGKALRNAARAHVVRKGVDCSLPFRTLYFLCDTFVGDDPRIAFSERHEYQHAGAILCAAYPPHDKLFERGTMRPCTSHHLRHQCEPKRHPGECKRRDNECHDLQQENSLNAPLSKINERPRRQKCQRARPQDWDMDIFGRRMCEHADDLSIGAPLRVPNGVRDRRVVFST